MTQIIKASNKLEVRRTELGYVTSIDRRKRTFFAQFCKFTNDELVDFNAEINRYCKKIVDHGLTSSYNPKIIEIGKIYCARYNVDNAWYRIYITELHDDKRSCRASFIDYGNSVDFRFDELIQVDPNDLPCIERAPFGVNCSLKDSEKLDDQTAALMLDAVFEEYILLRALEKNDEGLWHVDLPKVAYNSSFWLSYHIARNKLRTGKLAVNESEVNQQLLSREEMIAAGLDT